MIKKFNPVILIIISSFLLSACNLSVPSQNSTDTPSESKTTVTQGSEETFSGSVLDLINQNKNITCVWSYIDSESQQANTGTIYVSGKKFRQQMSVDIAEEGKMDVNIISDGDSLYMWNSNQPGQGVKMKLDFDQTGETDTDTNVQSSVDLEKKFDYQCSPWVVDNSKFTLPEGIQFMDLSETMNQIKDIGQNLPQTPTVPESAE
jgi:uncharacterized protein (DUF1499 family)